MDWSYWLYWALQYLTGFAVLCSLAVVILTALAKRNERLNPGAQATYFSIRMGSERTMATLVVGFELSVCATLMVWDLGSQIMAKRFEGLADVPPLVVYLPQLASLALGVVAGYGIWRQGRASNTEDRPNFDIRPGERAYLTFAGIAFGNLGMGYAWRLPGMGYKIRECAAKQYTTPDGAEPEEYLTGNGTELYAKPAITVAITNPLLAEGVARGDIPAYLDDQRQQAARRYISELKLPLDLAFKTDPSTEEQVKVFEILAGFKSEITNNGAKRLLEILNEQISQYGFAGQQAQFQEVLFNDTLEGKIQRAFDEIAEAPGLRKDALNKVAVVRVFYDQLLELAGLKSENLAHPQRTHFLQRATALAFAAEGQGSYTYHDFGGPVPAGVLVGVGDHRPLDPANTKPQGLVTT